MKDNPARVAILILLPFAIGCDSGSRKEAEVRRSTVALTADQCQAIDAAKRFVVENGYTNLPPSKDTSRIKRELGQGGMPVEMLLSLRKGRIKLHPFGLTPGTPPDESGWTVAFAFTPEFLAEVTDIEPRASRAGRGVYVTPTTWGLETHMTHAVISLDKMTVRLPSEEETASACAAVSR